MHGQETVGLQMSPVQLESFSGEQMDGDGIARERVDGQNIELFRRFAFEREPGITWNNGVRGGAILQERELIYRDAYHVRVNFVERVPIGRPPIGGQRSRAKADHADIKGRLLHKSGECTANAGIVSV